jgi:type I restriction enzyme S subunit
LKYIAKINPNKSESGLSKNSKMIVTFLPMEKVSENGEIITDLKRLVSEVWEGFTYFKRNHTSVKLNSFFV